MLLVHWSHHASGNVWMMLLCLKAYASFSVVSVSTKDFFFGIQGNRLKFMELVYEMIKLKCKGKTTRLQLNDVDNI